MDYEEEGWEDYDYDSDEEMRCEEGECSCSCCSVNPCGRCMDCLGLSWSDFM